MLEVANLSCSRGDRRLFSGVTFTVQPGGVLCVQGDNGIGKTSLLRLVCGLMSPEEGSIRWQGTDIRQWHERYVAQLIYVGHFNGLKDDLTPLENLRVSSLLAGERLPLESVGAALTAMGLDRSAHLLPTSVLSQGQKRRVALARLWSLTRPLWVLDEPFAALDAAAVDLLTRRLQAHVSAGGMVVLATHQEVDVAADCVRHLRLTG